MTEPPLPDSSDDPYQTPRSMDGPGQPPAALGDLVRSWEKLRLLYNGILILPGLGVLTLWMTRGNLPATTVVILGIVTAVLANIAFLLGPIAELYIRAYFRGGESIGKGRWLIFSAGLLVSAGVFLLASVIPIFWPQST